MSSSLPSSANITIIIIIIIIISISLIIRICCYDHLPPPAWFLCPDHHRPSHRLVTRCICPSSPSEVGSAVYTASPLDASGGGW